MIALADEVQNRQRQCAQIHLAARDFQAVLRQAVLLIKPCHEFPECRAGLIRTVEYPLLDAHEILDSCAIGTPLSSSHVLLLRQPKRHQRQEQLIQRIARDIAVAHPRGDVDLSDPLRQQVRRGMKVDRRDHGDRDCARARGTARKAQTEHTALTHAQDIESIRR